MVPPHASASLIAGWYRRSEAHARAPDGLRELIQCDGAAFGPGDHPTTVMCLHAIDEAPSGPAIDIGCGSGLLAQAWAKHHDGDVLAIDADPGAVTQTARSCAAATVSHRVAVRHRAISALDPADLAGRVVLANLPREAHRALLDAYRAAPRAAILSGLRPWEAPDIVRGYRAMGCRHVSARRRGRFECHVLAGRE
jgi:ribosomal protein L11 methyltransferase